MIDTGGIRVCMILLISKTLVRRFGKCELFKVIVIETSLRFKGCH